MADPDASATAGQLDDTIARLLEARAATATAGNRRALFARMDGVLATAGGTSIAAAPSPASLHGGGTVRLRRIGLRNWKAFQRAELVIPEGEDGADVILIGGANGFGKSSILEAYALGLFGRRAVSEAGFLLSAAATRGGQRRSYIELVRKALHRGEAAQAEGVCGVTLGFDTEEGPVEVQRTWYFDADGSVIEDEEELLVRTGDDRQLPVVPTGEDPQAWHQAEIERLVLPAAVAPFLMFDGEQVERWSERKLSDQVRMAVTRMLGLDQLAGLASDLKDFARDRARGLGDADAVPRDRLADRSEELARDLAASRDAIAQVERELGDLRAAREGLLAELTDGAGASHATLQELLEDEHRCASQLTQARRDLVGCLADHGPLILAGRALRERVLGKLDQIDRRAREAALDPALLEGFWLRFLASGAEMPPEERDEARRRIELAWGRDEVAASQPPLYPHLSRRAAEGVVRQLEELGSGKTTLTRAAEAFRSLAGRSAELRAAVTAARGGADRTKATRHSLADIAARIEDLEGRRGELTGHAAATEAALAPVRDELERMAAVAAEAGPRLRAAATANLVAGAIEAQEVAIADFEHQRFAAAVTANFRMLSHKGQIERIEIGSDGSVHLFDGRARDVSDYRFSAGESQLFAMALIAAAGDIVGRHLPLIVDTPLGRLDTRHRESVLTMLAGRGAQTILLTQPGEMGTRELAVVNGRLAGRIDLEHVLDPRSGVGVSSAMADAGAAETVE